MSQIPFVEPYNTLKQWTDDVSRLHGHNHYPCQEILNGRTVQHHCIMCNRTTSTRCTACNINLCIRSRECEDTCWKIFHECRTLEKLHKEKTK